MEYRDQSFGGAQLVWLGSPRDAGGHFSVVTCCWSPVSPVCSVSRGARSGRRHHRRGSSLLSHIAGLRGGEGAPSGK